MFRISLILCLFTAPAFADVRLEYTDQASGSISSIASVKGSHARFESPAQGPEYVVIDTAKQTMTIVDPTKKTYTIVDKNTVDDLTGQMSGAMAQAMEQLKNLPPEQRAMMEQMMPDGIKQMMSLPEYRLERSGKQRTAAGHSCEDVIIHENNKAQNKLCLTDPANVDVSQADYQTMRDIGRVAKSLAGPFMQNSISQLYDQMNGVPVEMQDLREQRTDVLKTSSDASLDGSLFNVPAGYRKENPAEMMQRKR